eukprot:g3679.t1
MSLLDEELPEAPKKTTAAATTGGSKRRAIDSRRAWSLQGWSDEVQTVMGRFDLGTPSKLEAFFTTAWEKLKTDTSATAQQYDDLIERGQALENRLNELRLRPKCLFKVTTPSVLAKAREFFDCSTLNGAELENQPTSSCSLIGSHWEQRILSDELMASTATTKTTFVSAITLAVFEDSGWYSVDYSVADTLTEGLAWGYKKGCDFATAQCITNGVVTATGAEDHFCTVADERKCSVDHTAQASCTRTSYASNLPSQFNYFTDSTAAGSLSTADYCPVYQTLTNRVCIDSTLAPATDSNYQGQLYGTNMRCFESTLLQFINSQTLASSPGVGCYEHEGARPMWTLLSGGGVRVSFNITNLASANDATAASQSMTSALANRTAFITSLQAQPNGGTAFAAVTEAGLLLTTAVQVTEVTVALGGSDGLAATLPSTPSPSNGAGSGV